MNIEEKIKESAAKVLFDSFSKGELPPSYGDVDIYFKQGYLLGIKEAFRWRDIKTEPPKEIGETYYILVTNDPNNEYDTGLFAFREVRYLVKTRKYWRPINLGDL